MSPSSVLVVVPAPTVADPPAPPQLADPDAPLLRADDRGVTRGDGVFETINAVAGRPQSAAAHLARLARSAAMLALPAPAEPAWRAALYLALDTHPPVPELLLRLVLTRGREGQDRPTGYLLAYPNGDHERERTAGVDILLLDRGWSGAAVARAPWLLGGAKTLSYATNMAAVRHVRAAGADDALFVDADGLLLEGPTCSAVARFGDRLVTPPPELGILAGTAQGRLFNWAASHGLRTAVEPVAVADLPHADLLMICSSGRLVAPVRSLDGAARPIDPDFQKQALDHLLTSDD